MQAVAKAKFQRYGRRKVGQVLDQIRGKNIHIAEQIVSMVPRGCADMVRKTLHSAAANLSILAGKPVDPKNIWIKEAFANQGPMKHLRRVQPGPQGRAMPYKRKVSHLTVVVTDEK